MSKLPERARSLTRAQRSLLWAARTEPYHVYDLGARPKTAKALVAVGLMYETKCELPVIPQLSFTGYGLTSLGLELQAALSSRASLENDNG